jgi:RNA polymerase sigma-70 factor (ECF subfamily)
MQSEEELYKAIVQGNITAFEMLFKVYYKTLCQYAYSFLNDRGNAEEIVQNTFIKMWERKSELHVQTSLKAYLYTMVRNGSLNQLKHERVRLQHAQRQTQLMETARDLVEEKVSSDDLESKIQEAINLLPEQCKLVFQLSRFEQLKYHEIADQLQISVKTVENHMGKALKLMRLQLKDYLPMVLVLTPWLLQ